ncbi:MAG: hypothetical protein KA974_03395 [Saprospiraceae bacterium]|nr:hypothetical protein [Saprospiraceae bacterium]
MNKAKNIRRIGAFVIALAVAMMVFAAVDRKKHMQADNLTITIKPLQNKDNLVTPEELKLSLRELIGSEVDGQVLKNIDIARIENTLETDPFVENVDCFVDANNKLNITVMQRSPLLRIIDKNGQGYYLDKYGKKVPLSKHFASRMLVANGNISTYVSDSITNPQNKLILALFDLSNLIQQDNFLTTLTEQIFVTPKHEIMIIPKIGKQTILLGDANKLNDKLKKIKLFYQEAMPYVGWQEYAQINVKYNGQIVAKK